MLTTTADRIRTILQGDGGKPFSIFMDSLLRTHGHVYGVPDSEIDTTVRVNVKDGGVDTEVRVPIPADITTQWFGSRTVWQYKGAAATSLRVSELVKGKHLKQRIIEGWSYRLAVADSLTAQQRKKIEDALAKKFMVWNPTSPPPRIVTADELAVWANRYVGLVLKIFFRDLTRDLLHFDAWGTTVRGATRIFVPVSEWDRVTAGLVRHVDFTVLPGSAVCTVQGEAGVGKSRLAYETLGTTPGACSLVVYAMDDSVLTIARYLANDIETRAVLVADECDAAIRLRLSTLLDGHKHRVRVIAIDNTLARPDVPDPEFALVKMPRAVLEEVLAKNFPEIDERRRRAYVTVADGFPRLAADLCLNDAAIAKQGNLSPAIPHIATYYRNRITPEQQRTVAGISLVSRIGYSGELATEFHTLCEFLGLDSRETVAALNAVHDGPGFVTRSGRYIQVTPELVAQVAFEAAWREWAQVDPVAFLRSFPPTLLEMFLTRVWRSAPEEVRRVCADYFRDWAADCSVADLTDLASVRLFVTLVDTHPGRYLPMLRRLIEAASISDLQAVTGNATENGEWGPRRALVWAAERFAQLPEHYDDVERILARLAAAESEPDIDNNATAIWRQGYRIWLSGTATPFAERLARLRTRLSDPDPDIRRVARTLLRVPFSTRTMRMASPAVVAGRIPPAEWRPDTDGDFHRCVRDTLALIADAVTWNDEMRSAVLDTLCHELRTLLARGYLPEVRGIFDSVTLTDDERVALIDALDTALEYDVPDPGSGDAAVDAYSNQVRTWRASLVGTDLHSRLVAIIGKARWGAVRLRAASEWQHTVDTLAAEFATSVASGDDVAASLNWLTTSSAQAAGEFGEALGRQDSQATLFDRVLATVVPAASATVQSDVVTFALGYVHGLLSAHPNHAPRMNAWIDTADVVAPEAAARIAISAGAATAPVERVLRYYDSGRIGAHFLYGRNFPSDGTGELPADVLCALLERLAVAAEAGDEIALRVGFDNLAMRLPYHPDAEQHPLLAAHHDLRALGWRLLEASKTGHPPHGWDSLVLHLSRFEPERAARFLAGFLASTSLRDPHGLERALIELAATNPDEVMEAVGTMMLDEMTGVYFFLGDHRPLFDALPDDVKQAWIEHAGVEGARRIARHLTMPYLTEAGEPVVPPLTAWVLKKFAGDDRTFREFVAGTHSWQWYSGDIAAQHEAEAMLARKFLDHPLRRVREWAAIEEQRASEEAAAERIRVAEQDLG